MSHFLSADDIFAPQANDLRGQLYAKECQRELFCILVAMIITLLSTLVRAADCDHPTTEITDISEAKRMWKKNYCATHKISAGLAIPIDDVPISLDLTNADRLYTDEASNVEKHTQNVRMLSQHQQIA